jgi:hypothetical protein
LDDPRSGSQAVARDPQSLRVPVRSSLLPVRCLEASSVLPPAVSRGPDAVSCTGAAVSRPAAGSARSRSTEAAYRAGATVYRGRSGGRPRLQVSLHFLHLCRK